jgi:hypothetical protein
MNPHNYIRIASFLAMGFLFASCERDANIEVPVAQPQLVVGSFLSTDQDSFFVSLTLSNPVFSGNNSQTRNEIVRNATVVISDGTSSAPLIFSNQFEQYYVASSVYALVPGRIYTLNVSTPGGLKAQGTCRLVSASSVANIYTGIDSIVKSDEFGYREVEYRLTVRWDDVPEEKNYYRVYAVAKQVYFGDTIYTPVSGYNDVYLKSDEGKDGQSLKETLYINSSRGVFEDGGDGLIGYEVYVLKTDEHYYRYYKSLSNYSGDDPFSEPVLIYTNVENGLGIFCSYLPAKAYQPL